MLIFCLIRSSFLFFIAIIIGNLRLGCLLCAPLECNNSVLCCVVSSQFCHHHVIYATKTGNGSHIYCEILLQYSMEKEKKKMCTEVFNTNEQTILLNSANDRVMVSKKLKLNANANDRKIEGFSTENRIRIGA